VQTARAIEDEHLRGLRAGYDDTVKRYMALPEEVDAYQAGWERGGWAKAGLEARYRLRVKSSMPRRRSSPSTPPAPAARSSGPAAHHGSGVACAYGPGGSVRGWPPFPLCFSRSSRRAFFLPSCVFRSSSPSL
jgi:hypothetical protein